MVIQYPHPLLRKKIEFDPSLDYDDVVGEMYSAAIKESEFHGQPILGLAANQIGIETRVILYRDGEGLHALINPQTRDFGPTVILDEACGSLPGYQVPVERYFFTEVKTNNGTFIAQAMGARAIQHEIDHLNGILLIDREYGS